MVYLQQENWIMTDWNSSVEQICETFAKILWELSLPFGLHTNLSFLIVFLILCQIYTEDILDIFIVQVKITKQVAY